MKSKPEVGYWKTSTRFAVGGKRRIKSAMCVEAKFFPLGKIIVISRSVGL